MNTTISLAVAGSAAAVFIAALARRKKFLVPDGHYGLLYHNGKYRHRISPGRHCFWKGGYAVRLIDMRRSCLPVTGEQILSADGIGVSISVVLTYQIIQAETVAHEIGDSTAHLGRIAQAALRTVIGTVAIERLCNQHLNIDGQVFALVHAEADKAGIVVHAVEIKDVIIPAGLEKITPESPSL